MQNSRCKKTPVSSRAPLSKGILAQCLVVGLAVAPLTVTAGPTAPNPYVPITAAAPLVTRVSADTISLIAGLMGIERDLLLGNLFLKDGLVSAEGSHFTHPRHDNFPAIKDGLAQAGAPDLEPLLIALENAKDKDEVLKAYNGVLGGLQQARQALQPTEQDLVGAIVATTEAAAALIDPSGTTEIVAYQEAWGLLMVARGQLDLLAGSSEPGIKQSATRMALAFDDVILFAPDPAASGPVPFDPALVTSLLATLQGQAGSI